MIINTHFASDCQLIPYNSRQYNYFPNFNVKIRNIISNNISEITIIKSYVKKIITFTTENCWSAVITGGNYYNFIPKIDTIQFEDINLYHYNYPISFPSVCKIECDEVFSIRALEYKALMHCIQLKYDTQL